MMINAEKKNVKYSLIFLLTNYKDIKRDDFMYSAKNRQAFVPPKPKEFFMASLLFPTLFPRSTDVFTIFRLSDMPSSGLSKFIRPGIRHVCKDLQAMAASIDPAALII